MITDINSSSHSRNNLEILQENGISYVKKTFYGDINRAKSCIEKQKQFIPLDAGRYRVSAAVVTSLEIQQNYAVLLMPFVEGLTGPGFAIHGGKIVTKHLSLALSSLIYHEMAESLVKEIDTNIFIEKIAEVIANTESETLIRLLKKTEKTVSKLPNKISFPIGPCHGDLTLSNVILNSLEGVILIDFLDTFLESPLQDVAKLNQDFIHGWSFRKESHSLQVKSTLFCKAAYPNAAKQLYGLYKKQVDLLTIMALARIAPYVTDQLTELWVATNLTNLLRRELL